jgi:RNA polymerase sigma-70 factor, ECF subfamily
MRDARIPYEVPEGDARRERLQSVLRVIYLVYNEGYLPTSGVNARNSSVITETIYLCRLLVELDRSPEAIGLLALMLLQESRRITRLDADGDIVVLEDQDRARWDRAMIDEGVAHTRAALAVRGVGPYAIQAAIAALHAEAQCYQDTDWHEIVGLYDVLMRIEPTPVVALNRAVALAMRDGAEAGLVLIEMLLNDPSLQNYHLAHAARADLCRRLGRFGDARISYEHALAYASHPAEQRFLKKRLTEITLKNS